MAIKQLSVFVDNKKGALSDITSFLAKQGIDLRAMSIADTQDFGILRLIVNDTERAAALLRETEAIDFTIKRNPGLELAEALQQRGEG